MRTNFIETESRFVSRHTTDRSLFCAFQADKLDTYLPKMVHAGYRVIILEAE